MCVAPAAMTDDGLLHVTVIGNLRLPEVFWHLPKLYTQRIGDIRKVRMATCRKIEASSGGRVLLDVDGEQPGTLPARFEIVPAALNILAG
ncbi:MAG: putative lipid kinase [Syntrophaceae bacterium PtaU1.Bin231]|nr:MAG: putative lipid kinase [Syntrophaceae bacterium PtaU1.Bin231]